MKMHLLTSVRLTMILLVLVSGIYPAVVWGIGQIAFREKVNGSLIIWDGRIIGSALIGQSFTSDRFFHARPSAAGSGYDAMASGGSNLGPTSQRLYKRMKGALAEWKEQRPASGVPADAVTASGSGLDPHISPANARTQAARVARANQFAPNLVEQLILQNTEGRLFGIYGQPRVNVLRLNLDIEKASRR